MNVGVTPAAVTSLCTRFSQLQVVATAAVPEAKLGTPLECEIAIKHVMSSPHHESMIAKSRAIFDDILGDFSDLKDKVNEFLSAYPDHGTLIRKSSWRELKGTLREGMVTPREGTNSSLADFRTAANKFINDRISELGRKLGLPKAVWTACGSPGYDSDVDVTVQIDNNSSNIKDAVFYKTLRDLFHVYVFGGSSRDQLHTESLIPHAAQINIFAELHSPIAQQYFQTGEKASVVLQQLQHNIGLHRNPTEYQKSKQRELDAIAQPSEKEAMQRLYEQVEALMARLDRKIEETCRTLPEDTPYDEVRELVYIPLRLELAERCSNVQQRIKEYSAHPKLARTSDELFVCDNKMCEGMPQGEEALYLELQKLLIMVTILQNDGTISVAEGKATLLEEGGQMHANVVKERRNSISKALDEGNQKVLDTLAPRFARKKSLTNTLSPRADISGEYAKIVLGDEIRQTLGPLPFKRPSCLTFLLAAFEESMQLQHEILAGLDESEDAAGVAIRSGKYALRVTRNLHQALKEFQKELEETEGLKKLLNRAAKLENISTRLEKCKRAKMIDSEAATILLTNAVYKNARDYFDETGTKGKFRTMFEQFDPKGEHDDPRMTNPLMLPSDRLNILCKTLEGFHELYASSENEELRAILEAHSGFDRLDPKYSHLKEVHQKASLLTLQDLNLTTKDQVRQFLDKILKLGADVRNMARDNKLLALSTKKIADYYDFAALL